MKRATILALSGLLLFAATGCEGESKTWGPVTSSYKGQVRVEGKGRFYDQGSRKAVNAIQYRDRMPNDGNSVHVHTQIWWWKHHPSLGRTDWVQGSAKTTPAYSRSTFTDATVSWDLDSAASRARANPQVCAQMGWPIPDSCTSGGVPTLNY